MDSPTFKNLGGLETLGMSYMSLFHIYFPPKTWLFVFLIRCVGVAAISDVRYQIRASPIFCLSNSHCLKGIVHFFQCSLWVGFVLLLLRYSF